MSLGIACCLPDLKVGECVTLGKSRLVFNAQIIQFISENTLCQEKVRSGGGREGIGFPFYQILENVLKTYL